MGDGNLTVSITATTTGFFEDTMAFKLTGDAHAQALALQGSQLFDPSKRGRPMKEWVQVPFSHGEAWPALAEKALEYVGK